MLDLYSVGANNINSGDAASGQILIADGQGGVSFQNNPGKSKRLFMPVPTMSGSFGDFAANSIATAGSFRVSFHIPEDFGTLEKIVVLCIPTGSITDENIDLTSDYGAVGEAYNNHSESNVVFTVTLTASELSEIDLSSVLTNIAAGDFVGVLIDHQIIGTTLNYIGLELHYTTP